MEEGYSKQFSSICFYFVCFLILSLNKLLEIQYM